MSTVSSARWQLAAVVLVGLNLRPAIASIGPLLDTLQRQTGLGDTGASLLTTVPVLLMGAGALGGRWLLARLGVRTGVGIGIALIALACAMRLVAGQPGTLMASALLAGLGIATVQALLPAFVKARFAARASSVMGLYSTSIMGGAVLASVIAPLVAARLGWQMALAGWSLPAVAAVLLWPLAVPRKAHHAPASTASPAQARPPAAATPSARATAATPSHRGATLAGHPCEHWRLALFFGLGTGAYTLVLAWLPPYYVGLGWSPAAAGGLLGGVTLAEVVAGLAVSAFIDRLPDRRPALYAAIAALFVGLIALIAAPAPLALPAAVMLGLGIGALFPLSLIVALDAAPDPVAAGALVSFVQGVGYLIAALFPFVAGLIRERLADLTPAWIGMAAICAALVLLAIRIAPARPAESATRARTRRA